MGVRNCMSDMKKIKKNHGKRSSGNFDSMTMNGNPTSTSQPELPFSSQRQAPVSPTSECFPHRDHGDRGPC